MIAFFTVFDQLFFNLNLSLPSLSHPQQHLRWEASSADLTCRLHRCWRSTGERY